MERGRIKTESFALLRTTETVVILSAANREASPEGEDLGFDVTSEPKGEIPRAFGRSG